MDLRELLVSHVTLLLITIAGFVFQWLRESRHHRWQQEQLDALHRSIKANGNGVDV